MNLENKIEAQRKRMEQEKKEVGQGRFCET